MSKCILCGNKKYEKLFSVDGYALQKCLQCGLVKTSGKGKVSYEEYHRDSDYKKYEYIFRNIFEKRFNIVRKTKKTPGKILDIGTSSGTMLDIFRKAGWETWGVEPSKNADRATQKGHKIIKAVFEKAQLPKNYFDVVIINHTLEHLDDPLEVLGKIRTLLKRKGIVYVDVPNFASLSSKLAGKGWKYILPDEHIHHFTPNTLTQLLKEAGFRVVWSQTWSGMFDYGSPLGHVVNSLVKGRLRVFLEILQIPGNLVSTVISQGTSLAMIGEKS